MINLKGINRKNKHHIQYPDVFSAVRPIPHSRDLSVPEPDDNMECYSDSEHGDMTGVAGNEVYKPEDDQPVPSVQAELSDLTRKLNASKECAQLLGSRLKEKHLLSLGTMFYWGRDRERELGSFSRFRIIIIGLL